MDAICRFGCYWACEHSSVLPQGEYVPRDDKTWHELYGDPPVWDDEYTVIVTSNIQIRDMIVPTNLYVLRCTVENATAALHARYNFDAALYSPFQPAVPSLFRMAISVFQGLLPARVLDLCWLFLDNNTTAIASCGDRRFTMPVAQLLASPLCTVGSSLGTPLCRIANDEDCLASAASALGGFPLVRADPPTL